MSKILTMCLLAALLLTVSLTPAVAEDNEAWNNLLTKTVDSIDKLTAPAAQLTVNGSATVTAAPDQATLMLGVTQQGSNVGKTQQAVNTAIAAIIEALQGQGIAPEQMATADYSISPTYDYSENAPVLTGYQVTSMLRVTVDDFAQVGAVIDAATAAGANQTGGISFGVKDREAMYRQALAEAVDAARGKASLLAQAAGKQLGDLLSMTEDGGGSPVYRVFALDAKEMAGGTQVLGGTVEVGAQVTLVFNLK